MENLFVYGTLKDPKVQARVFGRIEEGEKDVLLGYKRGRVTVYRKIYPALVLSKDNSIDGLVLSLTKKELSLTDKYETRAYRRIKTKLKSGKSAWVYIKS